MTTDEHWSWYDCPSVDETIRKNMGKLELMLKHIKQDPIKPWAYVVGCTIRWCNTYDLFDCTAHKGNKCMSGVTKTRSLISPLYIFLILHSACCMLWVAVMFDNCPRSSAAETPVKYGRVIQYLCNILMNGKLRKEWNGVVKSKPGTAAPFWCSYLNNRTVIIWFIVFQYVLRIVVGKCGFIYNT